MALFACMAGEMAFYFTTQRKVTNGRFYDDLLFSASLFVFHNSCS